MAEQQPVSMYEQGKEVTPFQAFIDAMVPGFDRHTVYVRWCLKMFIPSLHFDKPVDIIFFGSGTALLETDVITGMIVAGIPLRSVTLTEPDGGSYAKLLANVAKLREQYPGVSFYTQQATLEQFEPEPGWPNEFDILFAIQIVYYLANPESAVAKLVGMMRPNAKLVFMNQVALGFYLIAKELESLWGERRQLLVHMGVIRRICSRLGLSVQSSDLLDVAIYSTRCFVDGDETGMKLMDFILHRGTSALSKERLAQARLAIRRQCNQPDPDNEPDVFILPQPAGAIVVERSAAPPD